MCHYDTALKHDDIDYCTENGIYQLILYVGFFINLVSCMVVYQITKYILPLIFIFIYYI